MYKSEHLISAKHYLVFCSISFALGIFLFLYLNDFLFILTALVLCGFFLVLLILLLLKAVKLIKLRLKFLLLPLFLILFTLLGMTRIYFAEHTAFNTLLTYTDKEAWVYGYVTNEPRLTQSGFSRSMEVEVVQIDSDASATGTIVLYVPSDRNNDIKYGDKICCWAKLSAPARDENHDNFDYYTQLRGRNIFLVGNTKNINRIDFDIRKNIITLFKEFGLNIRYKLSETVSLIFYDQQPAAAILKGILLGDKSGFTDEMYEKFANAGISHIVAVSGLHLSILFSFLMIIFTGRRSRKRYALIIAVPFILSFVAISAFSPSVCRAAIMLLIAILAAFLHENYDPATSLFAALGIIIAFTPYSLFSKSLLLSFFATLGIFAYFKYLRLISHKLLFTERLPDTNWGKAIYKGINMTVSSLSLSLASLIGTACFLVLFFNKISTVQFLTNLWCIPLVSVIFCLGYICCLMYFPFPRFTVTILKPLLTLPLEIIRWTIDTFGDDRFTIDFAEKAIDSKAIIIYIGSAVMLYFMLKLICDCIKDKELNKRESNS
ncbi:MAG: ComEC family competence protein [Ruminococcaceae bacterium]|nr:ComEC family competence protein [Oscillospiraceae bacterium]